MFNKIKKTINTKKIFKYKKNNCDLSFSLNVDTEKELIDFKCCLEEALKDINKILN